MIPDRIVPILPPTDVGFSNIILACCIVQVHILSFEVVIITITMMERSHKTQLSKTIKKDNRLYTVRRQWYTVYTYL